MRPDVPPSVDFTAQPGDLQTDWSERCVFACGERDSARVGPLVTILAELIAVSPGNEARP
jgi:hypothetical protein